MPQPKKAARFGGTPAHHNRILSNLATELIRHGRIRTTEAKAKTVQPLAERMITFAKRGDVHSRRQVLKVIRDKDVVHKLFADVGPAFAERDGGYTRVLKLGPRKGDAAPMALIELVEGISLDGEDGALDEAPRRRWSLRRRKGGTQSTTARERAEDRMAAVDRGEDVDDLEYLDDLEDAEAVPAGTLPDEGGGPVDELEAGAAGATDVEAPQVTPEQVEARLAAADEGDDEGSPTAAPVPTEEQDAPAPERVPDETPETPTEDAPEGGDDAKP